ncbi:MAG: iron ABC transporter permease [Sandaracinaceae bacterium]|jgi:iron complex transport system permease protein|nr:iron ABC transporter permease [Sandaracinaceae bacterium]MBP7683324.1 iron ABC transporter permease [Deltaproteobacteria bacterium]MBK6809328.1 iron ABC transporter permease [Sandaracinaceae bacterium]MBK7151325.1 iron ABC transporter permease [Sandaracinaceae bacterium]MBK7778054.1 iron ABC transporter permease [Sandaracinaceae bacterium]
MARRATVYITLTLLTALAFGLSLWVGAGDLSDAALRDVFLSLRGARALACMLAGSALGVAGVLVQGLFRNTLASPDLLGTTAGANLGGRLAILAFQPLLVASSGTLSADVLLPLGCLVGAALSLALLLVFVRQDSDSVVLLLVGFILGSLFLSVASFVTSIAQESWEVGRAVVAFALGSVTGTSLRVIALCTPLVLVGTLMAFAWGRTLDVLLSGEEEAKTLGVDVRATRSWVVIWVSVLTAAAVTLAGSIAFVGLIVPHVLRPIVGSTHRSLVPAAALLGGAFAVLCDVAARSFPTRAEVPLGVVTGLLGAPVFLWLLLRQRRMERDA